MIPLMVDALTGYNPNSSGIRSIPGNVIRMAGTVPEYLVPGVGLLAGANIKTLGDAADFALDQPAPPGNPDYSTDRRRNDAYAAMLFGSGAALGAKALGAFGRPIMQFITSKTPNASKGLTQKAPGVKSFLLGGRPGKMSPKASEVSVYGHPYRPNSDATARSIGAREPAPMPHEPEYYITHSRDDIPTEYGGLVLTPGQYRQADAARYAVNIDENAPKALIPIRPKEDVLDFTKGAPRPGDGLSDDFVFVREPENTVPSEGTSLIVPTKEVGSYTGPTVEVHGTPRVKPAAEAAPAPTEAEMFREVPTFKYNREATAQRMPKRPVSQDRNDKFNMWKQWEREVSPEAARDYAFEQWYKNAPIGGVQGMANDIGFIPMATGGIVQQVTSAIPTTRGIASWLLGSGTPSDTTEKSAPTAPKAASDTVGKRMKAAGFEPRTRTQSRQTEKPKQSNTDIRLQNFDTNF